MVYKKKKTERALSFSTTYTKERTCEPKDAVRFLQINVNDTPLSLSHEDVGIC